MKITACELRPTPPLIAGWPSGQLTVHATLEDGTDPITNAQMVTLGRLMRDHKADRAIVSGPRADDPMKLVAFDLTERGAFVVNGGIEPDGRAHT